MGDRERSMFLSVSSVINDNSLLRNSLRSITCYCISKNQGKLRSFKGVLLAFIFQFQLFCMSNYRYCVLVNEITFPKVSACYFSHFVTEHTPNNTLVFVYITYITKCTINQRILFVDINCNFYGTSYFYLQISD